MAANIIHGECINELAKLDADSIDSCVTDPPYHLTTGKKGGTGVASLNPNSPAGRSVIGTGFMGKAWDGGDIAMKPAVWEAVYRVLKPGGHLLAFGGTRTHHRVWSAIEDAGFEIRDTVMWVYGSGFPKSHDAGNGWGTALKPAWEPIVVARKPLIGTVAENVQKHGTGALNIDGCRVGTEARYDAPVGAHKNSMMPYEGKDGPGTDVVGRWPANLIHDGSAEVAEAFPDAKGQQGGVTGNEPSTDKRYILSGLSGDHDPRVPRVESEKSAARFFYCAKASKSDRNEGCTDLPDRESGMRSETSGQHITRRDGGDPKPTKNNHPTVKPTELMRYLCRLVTPSNGLILDPFMGSGSTGKAALLEGFRFLGIEREAEYVTIARARLGLPSEQRLPWRKLATQLKERNHVGI